MCVCSRCGLKLKEVEYRVILIYPNPLPGMAEKLNLCEQCFTTMKEVIDDDGIK